MIVYTWKFPSIGRYVKIGEKTGVVFQVQAVLQGNMDIDGILYQASDIRWVFLDNPTDTFVPYEQLTHEIVQSWSEEKLGTANIDAMKAKIVDEIQEQITPSKVYDSPPWGIE